MTHIFSGLMVAAAASAASFWGVLTHPVSPAHMASTTPPAFATTTAHLPMHPPFVSSTTAPGDGWMHASSSLEHMPRPVPAIMEHRFASSTASTTWGMGSTTRPHPMPIASTTGSRATSTPHLPPQHTEGSASTSAPGNGGFWQRLFRFF